MSRFTRAAALAGACVLLLSACGGGGDTTGTPQEMTDGSFPGRTADQIMTDARAAAQASKAVKVTGRTDVNGRTFTFDIAVVDGRGEVDTVSLDEGSARFVRLGDVVYVQPDEKIVTNGLGAAANVLAPKLAGKWLQLDSAGLPGMATYIQDLLSFLKKYPTASSPVTQAVPAGATLTRTTGRTVDGRPTTGIAFVAPVPADMAAQIAAQGEQPPAQLRGTVHVATEGRPYPLAIESNGGVDLTLTDWDEPVKLTPPPAKQVTSLAKIGLGGF